MWRPQLSDTFLMISIRLTVGGYAAQLSEKENGAYVITLLDLPIMAWGRGVARAFQEADLALRDHLDELLEEDASKTTAREAPEST